MPRTLLVSLVPASVVAAAWLRLESPVSVPLRSLAVVAVALLPALVRPLAARLLALLVALAAAVPLAYDVSWLHPRHVPWTVGARFGNGFLDFYDVRTPFDPRVHFEMRAVVLTAAFGFALALGIAVATRRPVAAVLVLLVGAGWPATLSGDSGALAFGALILVAALIVFAGLTSRRIPVAALPAAVALALAAVVASTSSAVAKGGVISWQHWDPYTAPAKPVSVAFVWDAQYNGIRFPRKRTTVLEIKAPRSLYWRAAVLDTFGGERWRESPPLRGDTLEPRAHELVRQDVTVLALADTRLVGASVPLRFDAGEAPIVSHAPGFAQLPSGLTRGFRYTAWSSAPQPTSAQLAHSKARYPVQLTEPGTFLDVGGITMAPYGRPLRAVPARDAPLQREAVALTRGARTPYAATAAIESWFRGGDFTYTNHPPRIAHDPLVAFVTQTRAGYCQHFAGAMAVMLRSLGIPARVAVGFSSGTYDGRKKVWRVSDHDAHAWVEAWFAGYGWLPFDPTPSVGRPARGELGAPYAQSTTRAGRLIRGLPADPRTSAHHHGEEGTGVKTFSGGGSGASHRHGGSLVVLLLLVLGGVVAAVVAIKLVVRRVRYATRDPRRLAAACRQELADYLLDQNIAAARSATLHELGAIVRHELSVDPDAFVAAASAARFGPPGGSGEAARAARRELRALLRRMRSRLGARDRMRGLLSLRSLGFAA